MGRFSVVALMVAGCGSVSVTNDAPIGDPGPIDGAVDSAPACGGAGQTCCASNMCSADLTCTTADQTCRASLLFVGGSINQTTAYVAHGSGSSFTVDSIGMGNVGSIWGTSATDVWAIGIYNDANNAQKSYARHWNGTTWETAIPFASDGFVYGLWGNAPNNYWAFTNGGGAYHWTGTTWGSLQPIDNGQVFTATWGASATNIWAFASNRISHYDGAWTTSARSDFSASKATGVRASGELWAGGSDPGGYNPEVLHVAGATATVEPLSADSNCHSVVAMWAGPSDVWAVTSGLISAGMCTTVPRLFHRTTSWTEVTGVASAWQNVVGMWGTSNKDLYVAGRNSSGAATLFHYDGAAWTPVFTPSNLTNLGVIWGAGGSN